MSFSGEEKNPQRPRAALPEGPFWTVEQAINVYLHRNDGPRRMYEIASVFEPENLVPDVFAVLGTYRTPPQILAEKNRAREVFEAFRALRQIFAAGDVPTVVDGLERNPAYWRVDPTRQIAEEFAAANGDFRTLLAQIALETEHVRIPVAKLVRFFSESAKLSGEPPSLQADNKPLPATDEEPSALRRRGRPSNPKWGIIIPKVQALVEKNGPYDSIADAVEEIDKQFIAARREPFDPTWTARWIKKNRPEWLVPELRPTPKAKRTA